MRPELLAAKTSPRDRVVKDPSLRLRARSNGHYTLKNRILLENYFLPGALEAQISGFVEPYSHARYHASLENLTPADAHHGSAADILRDQASVRRQTLEHRRLQHRKIAA